MKTLAVIPARYASSRFPGKPLKDETGRTLVQHVYDQVLKAKRVDSVVVATDDPRIEAAVRAFGGNVEMTSPDHPTGTDRIAEVASRRTGFDLIVNVQGDEPEIQPDYIDRLIQIYETSTPALATLACPFSDEGPKEGSGSPLDPACVKVVLGKSIWSEGKSSPFPAAFALYFSRSLIPYPRSAKGIVNKPSDYHLHLGIYAYAPQFVIEYAKWPQGRVESTEQLEQLRILERGHAVAVGLVEHATPGIDTPDDYAAFVARNKKR